MADDEQQEAAEDGQGEDEVEQARAKLRELEEDPPNRPEDWPNDNSKYYTFGGPGGEHGYEEGPEAKLGPSDLRYHEDGKITIEGEEVDDPDQYRGEPIPGGPTDPDASVDPVEKRNKERDDDDEDEDDEDGE